MRKGFKVFDADAHVIYPPDLWQKHLDKKFVDRIGLKQPIPGWEAYNPVTVDGVWSQAELVLKVKEPLPEEVARTREGQILFTYLHLAAVPELIRSLQARKCIAIAYETVARADGSLPLLTPMSEVAGRLAVQEGAHHLGEAYGGRGILL